MATGPATFPPVNEQFVDHQTVITAAWLNFINQIANSPAIIPTTTAAAPPTTGTHATGDYVRNSNVTVLGPSTAPYIVDGWQCVAGGTPGTWVEIHLAVATTASVSPAPPPVAAPPYDQTLQCENFTGATALTGAQATLTGYFGTGYADWQTAAGQSMSGTFTGVPAGTYSIIIHYFNYGPQSQQNTITVDGVAHTGLLYPSTGYPNWGYFTAPFTVTFTGIGAPASAAVSTSTTGGTLAAGTYYYKVTAVNAGGETIGSAEHSVTTTGTTSSNTVPWTPVTGATGYNIYRGTTAGGENVKYSVTGQATASFLDTGAAGTSASPPSSDTTTQSHTIALVAEWGYVYYDQVELKQNVAAPAPPPAPAPAPAGSGYAFGSRLDGAYPYGIKPSASNATLDGYVEAMYNTWKNNRLQKATTFTATDGIFAGQTITDAYYVDTNSIWIVQPTYDANFNPVPGTGIRCATVSEAIGYGMLICVIMAGYDANAQTYFNGLYRLARGRPAYSQFARYYNGNTHPMNYLMDYRVGSIDYTTTGTLDNMSYQGGGWSATDGDMDIALALLMANRQWGSTGTYNYYQDALNTIDAIKAADMNAGPPMTGLPYVTGKDVSRTSDYMFGHFRSFNKATNDPFWLTGITNMQSLANTVIAGYSNTAKLLPDWIWQPLGASAQPSPGGKIEGSQEGDFAQNAIRDPWRMGIDFLYSNDTTTHTLVTNMVATIKSKASSNPAQTTYAYDLAGNPLTGTNLYFEPTVCGCQMTGAMVDAAHQAWLDTLVSYISGHYNTNYFSAELCLLNMIVASGNWWRP